MQAQRLGLTLLLGALLFCPGWAKPGPRPKPKRRPPAVTVELARSFVVAIPPGMKQRALTRQDVVWEPAAATAPWCQLAVAVREAGNVTHLGPEDARAALNLIGARLQKTSGHKVRRISMAGSSGYCLEYLGQSGPVKLKASHWMFLHSGQLLVVSLVCPPASSARWLPVAEALTQSVQIR